MTLESRQPGRNNPVRTVIFSRVYGMVVVGAIVLLVVAAAWLGLDGPAIDARLVVAACAWAVAVAASAVLLMRRRDPMSGVSAVSQIVALLGTATTFGLARGTSAGVLVAVPAIAFLVLAAITTVIRAEAPREHRPTRFD
ncbi:hypothetical protein [Cellulomonas hominis]